MTKIEKFQLIIDVLTGTKEASGEQLTTLVEMLTKEIGMIEKKKSSSGLTATQKENEKIKQNILDVFYEIDNNREIPSITIKELQENYKFDYTTQKLSALLNQLVKDEILEKSVNSDKKTVFTLVEEWRNEKEENTEEITEE